MYLYLYLRYISKVSSPTLSRVMKRTHKSLLRYGNILPYDHNRVTLSNTAEDNDYINASWIATGGAHKFIASQGPLPASVAHFLQMIRENKVTVVVGLTKLMEKGSNGKK